MSSINNLKGSDLENFISEALYNNGWIVFTRKNHCDILAWRFGLVYLIECKGYDLSKKQQTNAVKQLNNNIDNATNFLGKMDLSIQILMRILVAKSFHHNSYGIYQYTPKEFILHCRRDFNE